MFSKTLNLESPGLFVTATDTEVGKTIVTCAVGWHLRRTAGSEETSQPRHPDSNGRTNRVGVCKPLATGCRRDREGLVSEDAEALAHFADCRLPLEVINPVRYRQAVAPAAAAAMTDLPVDFEKIRESLERLDKTSDVLLIEGIGGILVPIDHNDPHLTVLDLIRAIAYPVLVVTRAGLGTLNHTAMTVRLLQDSGCRVAGLVVNQYEVDAAGQLDPRHDLAMATNRQWLERTTDVPILATVPRIAAATVAPHKGRLPSQILDAIGICYWPNIIGPATTEAS